MKKVIYLLALLVLSYFVFHKLLSIYESYAGFEVYHLQTILIQALPVLVSIVVTLSIGFVLMNTATSKLSGVSKYLITSYTIFLVLAVFSIVFSHNLIKIIGITGGCHKGIGCFDGPLFGYAIGPFQIAQNRNSEFVVMFLIPAVFSLIISSVTVIRNSLVKIFKS